MRTVLIVLVCCIALACGAKTRHVAVVADQTLSQVVFAIDDAQWAACHTTHTLSQESCAKLDPLVKQALQDVKALTTALQNAPKDMPLPKSLPALLADLNQIRTAITVVGAGPSFIDLSTKAGAATDKVIGLLQQFAGGQ